MEKNAYIASLYQKHAAKELVSSSSPMAEEQNQEQEKKKSN